MNNLIKLFSFSLLLVVSFNSVAQNATDSEIAYVPSEIEELLELVKSNTTLRSVENKKRMNLFLKNKNNQEKLLNDAVILTFIFCPFLYLFKS